MARRGAGSITKRKNGDGSITYVVRMSGWDLDPATGAKRRWYRQRSYPTRREAETGRVAWLAELAAGTGGAPSALTVAALLDDWMLHEGEDWAPGTRDIYARVVRRFLGPSLGGIAVQQLTVAHVEHWLEDLAAQGYARSSVILFRCPLVSALDRALRRGLVPRNVATVARVPRRRAAEGEDGDPVEVWDTAQRAALLEACHGHRHGPLIALLLRTGLRRGEALGLLWEHVTWPQPAAGKGQPGLLRVAQQVLPPLHEHRGPRTQEATKNKESARRLPLSRAAVAVLREQQSEVARLRGAAGTTWRDEGWVFPSEDGGPLHPSRVRYHLIKICEAASVPFLRVHATRHTYATHLLAAGQPIHVVSQLLGHSDPTTTMRVYTHVLKEQALAAVESMDAIDDDEPAQAL